LGAVLDRKPQARATQRAPTHFALRWEILQAGVGGGGTTCERWICLRSRGATGLGLTSRPRRAIAPAGFLRLDVSNIGQIQSDQRR
jgi:hypothetical protein